MHLVIVVVRTLGVLLALFLAMSALIALSGELHSVQPPPLAQRALSAAPAALLSVLLFLPQRFFLRGGKYKVLLAAYAISCMALGYTLVRDIARHLSGDVHWAIVPTGAAFFLVILCNGLALWVQHRKLPPNNSFKPTLLRKAA